MRCPPCGTCCWHVPLVSAKPIPGITLAGALAGCSAPTALRMLMHRGGGLAKGHALSALRYVASVGKPPNPEVVGWGQETLRLLAHGNWRPTEGRVENDPHGGRRT